jgi:signal transduction histidine kinase
MREERGSASYVLATSRDVTAKRQAERKLRESEVHFAAVSDATHDVQLLFAVQPDGDFALTYMNRAGLEAWGALAPGGGAAALTGRSLASLLAARLGMTEAEVTRHVSLFRDAIEAGQTARFEESIGSGSDERTAEVTVIPIGDSNGRVTYALRSSSDITDRKRAEAAQRRFSDDLERRVDERTAQLAMANRELEAFSYSLSHDLRAPLRSIEGFSRALIEDYEADLAPEALDYARRICVATGRMKQLLEDLLRLSQLPTANLDRERIDLSSIARNVFAELQASDSSRSVRIDVQEGMLAHGDTRLVSIAMHNLLGNAWKYTSKRPNASIEVGQTKGNGSPVTFVRDNGAGFDPQFAEHLFAPFQRLHRSEDFEGAGIGLATVRRIVAAHGGRVWADGRPDGGATFWVTLGGA